MTGERKEITVTDRDLAQRCLRGRVVVIDDDREILEAIAALLDFEGYACEIYPSALAYLQVLTFNRPHFPGPCCVLCDVRMPELDGLELQARLRDVDDPPMLLMSGVSGVDEAVRAFRGGAHDFLIKPIDADVLLAAIGRALAESASRQERRRRQADLAQRTATLTRRECEVARLVASGQTNMVIAGRLGIALRTVKIHRQRAMEKLGAGSMADLVRIVDEGGV
jgi:FixJ family two-component response regulator